MHSAEDRQNVHFWYIDFLVDLQLRKINVAI